MRRSDHVYPLTSGRLLAAAAVAASLAAAALAGSHSTRKAANSEGLHYVVNLGGDFEGVSAMAFDLADVGSAAKLEVLPDGLKGVLWLGNGYNTKCEWRLDDAAVTAEVEAARDHPKFSGIYYIADEPHPETCPDGPARVAERTKLIHSLDPDGRTFIIVQNGSAAPQEFQLLGNSADLIGVDPYPCNHRNAETGCDLGHLRARIKAALDAGIERERIVPVFQAFGQSCASVKEPWYRLPTEDELVTMLHIWDELVPREKRAFDMTYSWAPQGTTACPTLQSADGGEYPDLQKVFFEYFGQSGAFEIANGSND
ncbi:hypothetical protein R5H32_10220 [Defluviimonas sp. D31]|uniref:hypothetical protein n=1 Tax=Defluviimonas sp. D31 TaxID=3083253 RepID=UPI00296F521F|nr:hypothetical protein [Defluviimonas sp. D31]MDW4549728.1 hypothetical protein [Defluviimonas sp. D31]